MLTKHYCLVKVILTGHAADFDSDFDSDFDNDFDNDFDQDPSSEC